MKKIISCTLVLVMLVLSAVAAFAAEKEAVIKAAFKSDLSGKTIADIEEFVDLSSSDLVFHRDENGERSFICNCGNERYDGAMKAGRTYYIYYEFEAADGTVFPAEIQTDFTCEDGAQIISTQYVMSLEDNNVNYLYVCEKVTVKGNVFQKLFGFIADLILRIQMWSPY